MIWLIGAGNMSVDYAKVLQAQGLDFLVIGRGEFSAKKFEAHTGRNVVSGGLAKFLATSPVLPQASIVSVGVDELADTTTILLNYGVKKILVEKPAGLNSAEISGLLALTQFLKADLFVAYNRRFLSSVLEAEKIIKADGGVVSFNFEITERGGIIENLEKPASIKANWFFANTTHIVDLAFFLGGEPKELAAFTAGGNHWHPRATVFSGSGVSELGALFSYHGNWSLPGNWSLEILTASLVLIFRPLEKLRVRGIGTDNEVERDINNELDIKFKPGLYLQVKSFIEDDYGRLCSIDEQSRASDWYSKMANY